MYHQADLYPVSHLQHFDIFDCCNPNSLAASLEPLQTLTKPPPLVICLIDLCRGLSNQNFHLSQLIFFRHKTRYACI